MEELALAAMAMEWQCGVVEPPPPPILSVLLLPPLFDFAGIHPRHLRPDLKFPKLPIEFKHASLSVKMLKRIGFQVLM